MSKSSQSKIIKSENPSEISKAEINPTETHQSETHQAETHQSPINQAETNQPKVNHLVANRSLSQEIKSPKSYLKESNPKELNLETLILNESNLSESNLNESNSSEPSLQESKPSRLEVELTQEFWQVKWANGLTVLAEYRPHSRSFSAGFFVNIGSRDESSGLEGAAHFLEHLMFKGNAKMDALELNRRFDALGADYNAFTDHEMTAYHAVVLADQAEGLLELLFELMQPQLDPSEVELERQVILEEIEMYDDSPDSRLFDALRAHYYGDHPLAHPILGTRHSVANLTLQQLEQHRKTHYSSNQQVLVVCGNFDKTQILAYLERLIGSQVNIETQEGQAESPAPSSQKSFSYPHTLIPSRLLDLERKALPPLNLFDARLKRMHLGLMLPAPLLTDPLSGAAQVLAEILGGDTGRFYWALMDSGLADEVAFSCSESPLESHYEAYLSCAPSKVTQVWNLFQQVLQDLKGSLEQSELERVKRKLTLNLALSEETAYGRLFNLGADFVQRRTRVTLQQHQDRIRTVTLAQIAELLECFPLVPVALAALGPLKNWNWKS